MLKSNPSSFHGLFLILKYDMATGRWNEILSLGELYLQANPDEQDLYEILGRAYGATGNKQKLETLKQEGLKRFPNNGFLKNLQV